MKALIDINHPLHAALNQCGGVISRGKHPPSMRAPMPAGSCGACILECASLALGVDWNDDPTCLDLPDIRPLNDAAWPTHVMRTEQMMRVGIAIWPWREASLEKRKAFAARLAELTIRKVLPIALRAAAIAKQAPFLEDAAVQCEREGDASAALSAELMTHDAGAFDCTDSARNAQFAVIAAAPSSAVRHAALAGASASAACASCDPWVASALVVACDCWVQAAHEVFGVGSRTP